MMGVGWGMGADGWLWMFGGLILVIGIVILLMRGMGVNERTADRPLEAGPRQEPMEILRARFARGEITAAEFEEARRTLGDDR